MNYLLGVISAIVLILIHFSYEKIPFRKNKWNLAFFFVIVLASSHLMHPLEQPAVWLAWCLLFYCVLDDLLTKTIFIAIPAAVTLFFLIFERNPVSFLPILLFFLAFSLFVFFIRRIPYAEYTLLLPAVFVTGFFFYDNWQLYLFLFGSFAVLLLFAKWTKGKLIAEGDIFMLLPLSFLLPFHLLGIGLYLSLVIGSVVLTLFDWFSKEKEYAFAPYLVIGSVLAYSEFYLASFVSIGTLLCLLSFFVFFLRFFLNRKKPS